MGSSRTLRFDWGQVALGGEQKLDLSGGVPRVGVGTLDGEPPAGLVAVDDPPPLGPAVAELDDVSEREATGQEPATSRRRLPCQPGPPAGLMRVSDCRSDPATGADGVVEHGAGSGAEAVTAEPCPVVT
tara:strand:- start:319 stop:705 length:387 start_codon:yes stop_codon:yes gene_type:complete